MLECHSSFQSFLGVAHYELVNEVFAFFGDVLKVLLFEFPLPVFDLLKDLSDVTVVERHHAGD